MAIETEIRRVGNSSGIILPKEFLSARDLKVGDRVIVDFHKPFEIENVFGTLKGKRRMSGQEFKDLARSGWN